MKHKRKTKRAKKTNLWNITGRVPFKKRNQAVARANRSVTGNTSHYTVSDVTKNT